MNDDDMTYGHGISKMDVHKSTCDANPEDRSWLLFTPPDHLIPSCPKCHDVVFGATCILENEEHILHPCHHVLNVDEAKQMLMSAVSL